VLDTKFCSWYYITCGYEITLAIKANW
jgi:hypothetical protein